MQGSSAPSLAYALGNQSVAQPTVLDQAPVSHHPHSATVVGGQLPKNKGGRPKSDFWIFFSEQGELRGKTNRKAAKCNYCGIEIHDARVETLARHVTVECKKVTREARDQALSLYAARKQTDGASTKKPAQNSEAKRPGDVTSGISPEAKKVKREPAGQAVPAAGVGPETTRQLDGKLLRFLVVCDLPFRLADSAFFLDLLQSLRPGYVPASSAKLRAVVLPEEVNVIQRGLRRKTEVEEDSTIGIASYCPPTDTSLLTCTIFFRDRSMELLQVLHVHDAPEVIADELEKLIRKVGPTRVGSLVLDNSPGLDVAASIVLEKDGFRHILKLRCVAQAFSLAIGSMLGHPWARQMVVAAQRLVVTILSNPSTYQLFSASAKANGLSGRLSPCNRLQFPSVHACLCSMLEHEGVIRQLLLHQPHTFPELQLCHEQTFWLVCMTLSRLTEAYASAIASFSLSSSTLADLVRFWLIFARTVRELRTTLPQEVSIHCIAAFNRRYTEMDAKLLALILFMDPRYKALADSHFNFRDIIKEGVTVLQKRGFGEPECVRLLSQMQGYKAEQVPYDDLPRGGDCFVAKAWWLSVKTAINSEIVALAIYLLEVAPHATTPERLLGSLGWVWNSRRAALLPGTVASIATVRTHCERHLPVVNRMPTTLEAGELVGSMDSELLEVDLTDLATPEDLDALLSDFYTFDTNKPSQVVQYNEVLASHDFDLLHPSLETDFDPQTAAPVSVSSLGKLRGPTFDIDSFLAQHYPGGQQ